MSSNTGPSSRKWESGPFSREAASVEVAGSTILEGATLLDPPPALDWLDVSQDHDDPVPVFAAVISDHVETATGVCFRTWRSQELSGSFRSSLLIRSDGRRVRVTGNPSRWMQPENLSGVSTLDLGLSIFNAELVARGLPPFTAGARLHRLDWASNLAVGKGQELAFLRWAAGQTVRGKNGYLYPDGATCAYVGRKGSRKLYVKYYCKGRELRKHAAHSAEEHRAWRERCAEYCDSHGVVRHEVTVRGPWLTRRGLGSVGEWNAGGSASEVLAMYGVHARAEVAADPFGDVAAKLVDLGYGARQAHRLELLVRAWSTGTDLRGSMSQSAFYRARAPLLRLGWDIANVFDVARVRAVLPVISVRVAALPEWYSERSHLRAVA